jgi:hypothetical protein
MKTWLKDYDLLSIYKKWVSCSGSFCCFVKSTNFVSLKMYPDFNLGEVYYPSKDSCSFLTNIDEIDLSDTLIFIDYADYQSLDYAYLLYQGYNIVPILTFNNILHEYGIVGSQEFIKRLIYYSFIIEENRLPKGYAFIMDYNRHNAKSISASRNFFNNRYELEEEDLPSIEMLKELGVKNVLIFHQNEMKGDVSVYMDYLKENDINVIENNYLKVF